MSDTQIDQKSYIKPYTQIEGAFQFLMETVLLVLNQRLRDNLLFV